MSHDFMFSAANNKAALQEIILIFYYSKLKSNIEFLVHFRYPSLSPISVSVWGVSTEMRQSNCFLGGLTVLRSSKWGRNEVCGETLGDFNPYQGEVKTDNFKLKN